MNWVDVDVGVEWRGGLRCYQRFALFDIFLFEEELAVEIREVYGVEVQEGYVTKTGQNYVLYCNDTGKIC